MVRLFVCSNKLGLIVGAIFKYGVPERLVTSKVYGLTSASSNSCSLTLPPDRAIINLTVTEPVLASRYYHYYLEFESRDTVAAHYRVMKRCYFSP